MHFGRNQMIFYNRYYQVAVDLKDKKESVTYGTHQLRSKDNRTILQELTYVSCLVCLVVVGRTVEERIFNRRTVFEVLRNADLKLNPKKFILFRKEVQHLGHAVSTKKVAADPGKSAALRHWSTLKNKREVLSFLGLRIYYRRLIEELSNI